jgi:hypothetical protein
MAAKFFCDGCDCEIRGHGSANKWRVLVEGHTGSVVGATFDLCPGCAKRLQEQADPIRWPRAARVVNAA